MTRNSKVAEEKKLGHSKRLDGFCVCTVIIFVGFTQNCFTPAQITYVDINPQVFQSQIGVFLPCLQLSWAG